MGKNQHVVPTGGRWGIRGEGNSRLTSTFDRQSDAIAAARQITRESGQNEETAENCVDSLGGTPCAGHRCILLH